MQTFLPYSDFDSSARVLDAKRLGKQRVECYQLLKALADPTYGWQNHPATRMWRSWPWALFRYSYSITQEWKRRGFADTCEGKIYDLITSMPNIIAGEYPVWLGNEYLHESHREALYLKNPMHYGQWWQFPNSTEINYFWPIDKQGNLVI